MIAAAISRQNKGIKIESDIHDPNFEVRIRPTRNADIIIVGMDPASASGKGEVSTILPGQPEPEHGDVGVAGGCSHEMAYCKPPFSRRRLARS